MATTANKDNVMYFGGECLEFNVALVLWFLGMHEYWGTCNYYLIMKGAIQKVLWPEKAFESNLDVGNYFKLLGGKLTPEFKHWIANTGELHT